MRFREEQAFTFDDVLLEPQHRTIASRSEVDLTSQVTTNYKLKNPLISANMDTITEESMAYNMSKLDCLGILHRFMEARYLESILMRLRANLTNKALLAISVGLNNDDFLPLIEKYKIQIACIDIAHGDCPEVIELIKRIKSMYDCDVIAGNVATYEGASRLYEAGADSVKIGIGSGSLCSTRINTGCGFPQLSAILECAKAAQGRPLISDGGMRYSGDMVKSFAAGATAVMCGGILAGTLETPGEIVDHHGKQYKEFRGMASRSAMINWKGDSKKAPEGESTFVKYKGPIEPIISDLIGGIKSGCTYCNARNLQELRDNAVFVKVTPTVKLENIAHGK